MNNIGLSMTRIFKCKAETLYKALSEGALLQFTAPLPGKMQMDFREGGKYSLEWKDCGSPVIGVFKQIIPNKKIIFSWDKTPPSDSLYKTLVTVDLLENEGATTLTLRHEGFETYVQCEDHNKGWDSTLKDMMKSMRDHFAQLEGNKTGLDMNFKVRQTINAPIEKVFKAVQDGSLLSKYFPTNSTDSFRPGESVTWNFPNYPTLTLKVFKVVENECITFKWGATHVAFSFRTLEGNKTHVTIETTGYAIDQSGLDSSYSECNGWTEFLLKLRIYLENGIIYPK